MNWIPWTVRSPSSSMRWMKRFVWGRVHSFEFCRRHHRKEPCVSFIVVPERAG